MVDFKLHSPNFIHLQDFIYFAVVTSREENNVDPDQLASLKPADLDLHCFQNRIYGYSGVMIKTEVSHSKVDLC